MSIINRSTLQAIKKRNINAPLLVFVKDFSFSLESSVEHREEYVCGSAVQGTMTRNSHSIPRSCNAAMRCRKRAIRGAALLTHWVSMTNYKVFIIFNHLVARTSGQLRNLGLSTRL